MFFDGIRMTDGDTMSLSGPDVPQCLPPPKRPGQRPGGPRQRRGLVLGYACCVGLVETVRYGDGRAFLRSPLRYACGNGPSCSGRTESGVGKVLITEVLHVRGHHPETRKGACLLGCTYASGEDSLPSAGRNSVSSSSGDIFLSFFARFLCLK